MSRLLNKISNDFKLKLGVTDFILVSIHLFVGLAFWTIYNLDLTSGTNIKYWVFVYYFLVPLALVGLFFRNLRNFKLYLIWIVIGIKDTRFLTKLNPPPHEKTHPYPLPFNNNLKLFLRAE